MISFILWFQKDKMIVMGNINKGNPEGVLWAIELFCVLTVVVVIGIYTPANIHRPAHACACACARARA